MSKKAFGIVVALLCLLLPASFIFAGGGGGEKSSASAVSTTEGPLLPWKGEEIVFEGFGSDLGMIDDPNMPVVQAYRKTTGNVRIDWDTVPWNDYDTKLNLYFQSGDMPDIVWSRDVVGKVAMFGGTGIYLDWDKYKDFMPNYQRWTREHPFVNNVLTTTGERYAVVDITNAEYIGEGWFYNGSVLSKAGISGPPDTMDELLSDMKAIKANVPGADGFLAVWGIGYIEHIFSFSMHASRGIDYRPELGKWIHGPTMDPNYKKYINYLRECYEAGVFNLDALGGAITDERVSELRRQGNYGFGYMYYGAVASKETWDWEAGQRPPEGFSGMLTPAFEGTRYYWITVPHDRINGWGYMANAKVKNPELLAAYVDNIVSRETAEKYDWGVEGLTFRRTSGGGREFIPPYDDPAKRRDAGVGNFWDPRYIHYSDYRYNWFGLGLTKVGDVGREACARDIKALKAGEMTPLWSYQRPQMTVEQNDEVGKIMTPVNTFVDEQELKFVTGDRPMSQWDDFMAQIKRLGNIDRVLQYYNTARQFPADKDRIYPDLPPDLQ